MNAMEFCTLTIRDERDRLREENKILRKLYDEGRSVIACGTTTAGFRKAMEEIEWTDRRKL